MKKVLFAFSGGIDDLLAVHWLSHTRGYSVTAFLADLGQEPYLEPLGELALECGAEGTVILDLRQRFVSEYVMPTLQAGARYEDYLLSTPLARYALCEEMVRYADENGLEVIGHGASNQGNDQVRVEASFAALAPHLQVLAPNRELAYGSTQERLEQLRRRHLPERPEFTGEISVDRNLWGCGQVHGGLGDPWQAPPESVYLMTRSPEAAPDAPRELTIGFRRGTPTTLDGEKLDPVVLVERLSEIGGEHGIGRLDHVENALVGKTREIYEAPAATVLYQAHKALEEITQSRDLFRFKQRVALEFGRLVYEGFWFGELREALSRFVESTQRFVTGKVRLKLFKGNVVVEGRSSTYSLYDHDRIESPDAPRQLRGATQGIVDMIVHHGRSEATHRSRSRGR